MTRYNNSTYYMFEEEEFCLTLIDRYKKGDYEFSLWSMWSERFYIVKLYINLETFADPKSGYYQNFLDQNFMVLLNLSEKYSYNYFSYKFFDEMVTMLIKNKRNYHKHVTVILKYFFIKRFDQEKIFFFLIIFSLNLFIKAEKFRKF